MLLAFRAARIAAGERRGWLRAVRQVVGIPVKEVARRLGVCRWEVFRLEKSESESRIMLGTLRRAAEALDCDLVYALTPRQGTLEELAAEQRAARVTGAWGEGAIKQGIGNSHLRWGGRPFGPGGEERNSRFAGMGRSIRSVAEKDSQVSCAHLYTRNYR